MYPKTPQALGVQNSASGIPNSSAASRVKFITASETIHVTRGVTLEELSLAIRSRNGAKQVLEVE